MSRRWRIERLNMHGRWTWIAVGPDRVMRYYKTHAQAMTYATGDGPSWLKAEIERAKRRSAEVPERARPKYTG